LLANPLAAGRRPRTSLKTPDVTDSRTNSTLVDLLKLLNEPDNIKQVNFTHLHQQ